MSGSQTLLPTFHYVRLSFSPPGTDEITLRKTLQDALQRTFGLTSSGMYLDMLSIVRPGQQQSSTEIGGDEASAIVRAQSREDASKLMAAVAAHAGSIRLSVTDHSQFLPALVSSGSILV